MSTLHRIVTRGTGYVSPVLSFVEHLGDGAREAEAREQTVLAVRSLQLCKAGGHAG